MYKNIPLALLFHSHGNVILPLDNNIQYPTVMSNKDKSLYEILGKSLANSTTNPITNIPVMKYNESTTKALGYYAFGTMDQWLYTWGKENNVRDGGCIAFTIEIGESFYPFPNLLQNQD